MKLFFTNSLSLFMLLSLGAQNKVHQASWQQRVNCKINVQLNPDSKVLDADIAIDYFNNSPDTLRSIWMHIWPNAYKNDKTAFAKQQILKGKTDFHFSSTKERGSIGGFRFMADGDSMSWKYDVNHVDIIEVKLNKPLPPASRISISTPFRVKLPRIFSRCGYDDSFFSITQWFPKPAVYDVNGWNPIPYLDQGEFYSEFGDYLVNISVPKAYIVASTGHLTGRTDTVLNSSKPYVRYTYAENNIHDFAWFASKDFRIRTRTIPIGNDSVKLNVYLSGNAVEKEKSPMYYLDKGVTEYSTLVGNYPYKTCSVVIGPLVAGAGMEYPTITICGSTEGSTIMHEVGHNWFYGMLATNERRYPWMDESINTFFENVISGHFKPDPSFLTRLRNRQWLLDYQSHLTYLFSARQGLSQPLNLPSEEFTGLNYGSIVYSKGPLLFAYLRQQLGDSVFSKCVKDYFTEWKFRHPLPGDMQSSFERSSGEKLDWFFDDLLNENNRIDIKKTANGFKVKNSEKLGAYLSKKDYSKANPYGFLPETNYVNNSKQKLISIAVPFSLPKHNAIIPVNFTPVVGFNYYDRFYAGVLLYNRSIFRNKFEYTLMPVYSFSQARPLGYGKLNGLFLSNSNAIWKVEGGLQGHTFGTMVAGHLNQYYRINPYVKIHFRHKGKVPELIDKQLLINFYRTGLKNTVYDLFTDSTGITHRANFPSTYFFNYIKLTYSIESKHPVNGYGIKINAEQGTNHKFTPGKNSYVKTWINAFYKYSFAPKNKFFKSELFAGVFLDRKGAIGNQKFFLSGNSGNVDYLYNEAMIGRNEDFTSDILLGRQLIDANGNMRNILPVSASDKWMLALANEISLPGKIPFRIYADLGYYRPAINTNAGLVYGKAELYTTAGLLFPFFDDNFEIFIPLYQSEQFNYNQIKRTILNSIGFKLRLNKLDPFKLIDNYKIF